MTSTKNLYDYMIEAYNMYKKNPNPHNSEWKLFINYACEIAEAGEPNPFSDKSEQTKSLEDEPASAIDEATAILSKPHYETENASDTPKNGNIVTAVANKFRKHKE